MRSQTRDCLCPECGHTDSKQSAQDEEWLDSVMDAFYGPPIPDEVQGARDVIRRQFLDELTSGPKNAA